MALNLFSRLNWQPASDHVWQLARGSALAFLLLWGGIGCTAMSPLEPKQAQAPIDPVPLMILSDTEEAALGAAMFPAVTAAYTLLDTAADSAAAFKLRYVDSLGRLLAASQTDRPETAGFQFTFRVIDDDSTVDAFAVPGGYVFVFSGLVNAVQTESELTAVLAHQIGHLTYQDGAKNLARRISLDTLKGLIAAQDVGRMAQLALDSGMLAYNDSLEYRADTLAVKCSKLSRVNGMGIIAFYNQLLRNRRWPYEHRSTASLQSALATLGRTFTSNNAENWANGQLPMAPNRAVDEGQNIALHAPAGSSSVELDRADLAGGSVTDGVYTTRWSSAYTDTEWVAIDLGAPRTIGKVMLRWELGYATAYKILVSDQGTVWREAASITDGILEHRRILFAPVKARYVKMQGVKRFTKWGLSLYEFEVYEDASATTTR
jgi:hypothetical protein